MSEPYKYVVPLTEAAIHQRFQECGIPNPEDGPIGLAVYERLHRFLKGGEVLHVISAPDSKVGIIKTSMTLPALFTPSWKH